MNIEDLYPLVRPFAKGAPTPTLKAAIRRAARKLCFESWYAQRTLVIGAQVGVNAYALAPGGDEEVCGVKAAEFDGNPLDPVRPEQLPDSNSGTPSWFYYRPPATIVVLPTPDANLADALRVRVAVQPTKDAGTVPDAVGQNFDRALADGALAWLLAIPAEAWTDKTEALKREALFFSGISEARRKMHRGNAPRGVSVSRRFAI